jgi:glycosyltransferase involved in cell wall biosynthesis
MSPPDLSLVLPCFNEADCIRRTLEDCWSWGQDRGTRLEILVVDDGSTDGSVGQVESAARDFPGIRLLRHERNAGYGQSLRSGLDAAAGRVLAFMDSDGQFQPGDLDALVARAETGEIAVGVRVRRADPWRRRRNAWLYARLIRFALGVRARDLNCGLKAFPRELWPRIRPRHASGALFNGEFFLRARHQGLRWQEIPVQHFERKTGRPTGDHPRVILRMFRELRELRRDALTNRAPPPTARA